MKTGMPILDRCRHTLTLEINLSKSWYEEALVPMIKDYPVYDFKVDFRVKKEF
jgi:hypothetical protein